MSGPRVLGQVLVVLGPLGIVAGAVLLGALPMPAAGLAAIAAGGVLVVAGAVLSSRSGRQSEKSDPVAAPPVAVPERPRRRERWGWLEVVLEFLGALG